jgi:phosphohistidine swiveling domain-containing protein
MHIMQMTSNLLTTEPAVRAASQSASPIVPLADATDRAESGDKAHNLARLTDLGLSVPPAIVVTNAALEDFLEAGGLHGPITELSRGLSSKSAVSVACAADTIQALIFANPIPRRLRDAIEAEAERLGPGPFMVRSSARGEDGLGASFAGQLDSFGDVRSSEEVIQAVVRVWASRWSHRALAYGFAKGATLDAMGVIVQRQVASRWSGVLFTESPGNSAQMLMEFCSGMGEALVSGRNNPGRVTIARQGLRWSLVARPEGETSTIGPLVNGRRLAEIGRAALAIERGFGCPQDIEWALDDERFWIVQARPITDPAGTSRREPVIVAPVRTSPPTRNVAEVCWSNANVNENFPDPISPLLYSIASAGYYHYFRNLGRSFGIARRRLEAMEQPLRHIIGVHGARMYYNLTSIHAVLRSAPCGDLLAASFNQFVGSEPTDTTAAVPFTRRARSRVRQALEVSRIALQTSWQYVALERRVERFEERVDAFSARTHPDLLRDRPRRALLDDLRGFLHIRCHQWNDAALADAGSMVCYGVLQRLLARAFPEDDQQALHNSLLKALPDLVSGRPAIELWTLSEQVRENPDLADLFAASDASDILNAIDHDVRFADFRRALSRFQEQWGFRCSGELMLTVPSFQEDAVPLVGLIRNYLSSDADSPERVLERQTAERLADTARVEREIGSRRIFPFVPRLLQRVVVMRVLRWTQACICLRERARLKQALLYSRLRRIVLEIGARLTVEGRLERVDDIFFLTSDEIDALLSGSAMFPDDVRALVAVRRQGHAALANLTPPDNLTLGEGEYFAAEVSSDPSASIEPPALTGLGACGGTVTAPATVLSDVRESHRLRAGDVLVTRQTDPGWGPIFPLISGLVVERGGMLSHGAIIAREFGIPSVVGVKDATRRIQQGSLVTVDGDRGRVDIVGDAR